MITTPFIATRRCLLVTCRGERTGPDGILGTDVPDPNGIVTPGALKRLKLAGAFMASVSIQLLQDKRRSFCSERCQRSPEIRPGETRADAD
jgi:hypothetical protein